MRTRMVAIALCLVMVSAFCVTGAVSAAGRSSIRQFDIIGTDASASAPIGTLTIDTTSGHYTVNFNWARLSEQVKEQEKDFYRQNGQYQWYLYLVNTKTHERVDLGWIALTNNGANAHGEGTLGVSPPNLAKIAGWTVGDVEVFGYSRPVPTP